MDDFSKNQYLMLAHPAGDVKVRFLESLGDVSIVEHFGSKLKVATSSLRQDDRIQAGGIIPLPGGARNF